MSQLTKKEKAFCRKYLETGSVEEAKRFCKISKDCYELLTRDDILNEIKRLGDAMDKSLEVIAKSALKRLAVGSISDAVSLIFTENPDSEKLKGLDLFMVSEIKRKDNLTEIKFFDRFKAVQSLIEGFESTENAVPFYDALIAGAERLNKTDNGD
ncbi:MAG: terminase small subunit [Ruminococcus sp.]|nr:terminase small subunit [Ruminococcus sp.]